MLFWWLYFFAVEGPVVVVFDGQRKDEMTKVGWMIAVGIMRESSSFEATLKRITKSRGATDSNDCLGMDVSVLPPSPGCCSLGSADRACESKQVSKQASTQSGGGGKVRSRSSHGRLDGVTT